MHLSLNRDRTSLSIVVAYDECNNLSIQRQLLRSIASSFELSAVVDLLAVDSSRRPLSLINTSLHVRKMTAYTAAQQFDLLFQTLKLSSFIVLHRLSLKCSPCPVEYLIAEECHCKRFEKSSSMRFVEIWTWCFSLIVSEELRRYLSSREQARRAICIRVSHLDLRRCRALLCSIMVDSCVVHVVATFSRTRGKSPLIQA